MLDCFLDRYDSDLMNFLKGNDSPYCMILVHLGDWLHSYIRQGGVVLLFSG